LILLILAMEQRSGRNCVRAEQCWWKHSCLNRIIIYVQSCKTFSTIDECTLFYLHAYLLSLKGKHALHLMIYSFAQRKISGLEMRMKFATDYWNLKTLVASVIIVYIQLIANLEVYNTTQISNAWLITNICWYFTTFITHISTTCCKIKLVYPHFSINM